MYLYAGVYATVAMAGMALLQYLVATGAIKIEGIGIGSPYAQAFALGLSARALLHIRIFTVTVGTQNIPIGIETLVQLFEPYFARNLILEHFDRLERYIAAREPKKKALSEAKHLGDVKALIKKHLPHVIPQNERAAFEKDIDGAQSVREAMAKYPCLWEGACLRAFSQRHANCLTRNMAGCIIRSVHKAF